jgi:hypothetical protein
MKINRLTWVLTVLLILSLTSVIQGYSISGSQGQREIPTRLRIIYCGLWSASSPDTIPEGASWVVVGTPNYSRPREYVNPILNWYDLHPPFPNGVNSPFVTKDDVKIVENQLKTVANPSLWGIIGPVCEEHYRTHMQFANDLNTTWFNETLMGYNVYLNTNPGVTIAQWQDEMFLRFVRGFYNYFHAKGLKVGTTAEQCAISDIPYFYGQPAFTFIQQSYDFVFLYAYTTNLTDFAGRTRQYFSAIDGLLQNQKLFWILTRMYDFNKDTWELEAKALELKNCFDRNIVVTTSIYEDSPPFDVTWKLISKALDLYSTYAPYYETEVNGTNLLTGSVGNTYGWAKI